jgi:hypothetical protein
VFTPVPIRTSVISLDYYHTKMKNAITQISYQSDAVQNICLASAPTYDSPFCSLAIRPITDPNDPRYKDPNFNFPTEILNSPLNAAEQKIEGYEVQASYGFDASALAAGWRGHFSLRHLLAYQSENTTVNLPGTFPTWAVEPHLRQTTFVSYDNERWGLALQNQWLGKVKLPTSDNALNGNRQNYVDPELEPVQRARCDRDRARRPGRLLPDREQRVRRTRSVVPVEFGPSGAVLPHAAVPRRHGAASTPSAPGPRFEAAKLTGRTTAGLPEGGAKRPSAPPRQLGLGRGRLHPRPPYAETSPCPGIAPGLFLPVLAA